jgi:predicted protein tyrosine phosphatase
VPGSISQLVVSPYQFLQQALAATVISHAVSLLGESDRLGWPYFGPIPTLQLRFDDIYAPTRGWVAPTHEHIRALIEFGRDWSGNGSMLVHCRAGSSRSPAAAMILAAALERPETDDLVLRVATAKAYFKPHRGMLALADRLLQRRSLLVDLVGSGPALTRIDEWGPVVVPLGPVLGPATVSTGS